MTRYIFLIQIHRCVQDIEIVSKRFELSELSIIIPVKVVRVGKHFLRFRLYQIKIVDRPNLLQTNYVVLPAGTLLRDSGYTCAPVFRNIWYAPEVSKYA